MNKQHFVFHDGMILLKHIGDNSYDIPASSELPFCKDMLTDTMKIETAEGMEVKASSLDNEPTIDSHFEFCPLRQSYYKLTQDAYLLAGKCAELLYWNKSNRYCGVCGGEMQMHTNISKRCNNCGREIWPLLATAIIVLVRKDDQVLLVRAKNFKGAFHGLVAGFVETGENLEDAVKREVKEETGLCIKNIRYFGSQPWPYPCGLMIGFNADYDGGYIKLQEEELTTAAWFDINHLPQLPEKLSIARKLIDAWIGEKRNQKENCVTDKTRGEKQNAK